MLHIFTGVSILWGSNKNFSAFVVNGFLNRGFHTLSSIEITRDKEKESSGLFPFYVNSISGICK